MWVFKKPKGLELSYYETKISYNWYDIFSALLGL